MSEAVKLIFSLSVSGGLFALVLFALKPLLRNRLSKSFQYYIWLVVLLRFIVPFSFGINLMDYALNVPNDPPAAEETVIPNNPINPANINPAASDAVNNNVPNIKELQPSMPVTPDSPNQFDVVKMLMDNLLWIWLAGALISAAWNVLGYMRFIRYVHGAAYIIEMPDCSANIYKSRFAPTPMLVDVIKPRIYLPDIEYTDGQLDNILLHELTHLRRHDIWLKWFAALVVSAHWFNPIAYLMRREFNRACELACDEAVIRKLDGAAKQSYGDTLISVVSESRYPVGVMSVTMCEEKKKLKERLIAIMNYKKKTKIALLITLILAVVITGSAFAFGAQWSGFGLWKPTSITVQLPDGKIFDISAEDMTALILKEMNNPVTDIFIYSSEPIELETDYSLRFSSFEVLISERDKNGNLLRRVYQIRISPENKKMTINHRDYAELVNSDFNYTKFSDFWNALTQLPADAINETIQKDAPDYFSLKYTPYDWYANSSPVLKHIFYNTEGIINSYREAPSVMFNFIPMYQDENDPNNFEGIGVAILYYYKQEAETDSYDISLADLRQLAAKGDALTIADFREYEGQDVGSGAYVMYYRIENGYYLLLSSPGDGKPWYIRLQIPGVEEYIDIRYDDIDEFIGKYPVPDEINALTPQITLYEYDGNTDLTLGEELTKDETGWVRLHGMVFIDVKVPDGTMTVKTYYAEAGTEATAHQMFGSKYSAPNKNPPVSTDDFLTGNSFNVAEYYPNGFLGHIWAVITDADGVEHSSEIINVIYEPSDAPTTQDEIGGRPVISGSILADLTQGEQKISAAKLSAYRFYTNSKQITVSIPSGEYSGTFYLYDAENASSSIMEFALDQNNRTKTFTNLTSAKNYYLMASGIDDSVLVTVSD